jgi:hypothetical protein
MIELNNVGMNNQGNIIGNMKILGRARNRRKRKKKIDTEFGVDQERRNILQGNNEM